MMLTSTPSFDELLNQVFEGARLRNRHADDRRKAARLELCHEYDTAKAYVLLRKHHNNQFMDFVKAQYPKDRNQIQSFIKEIFAESVALGRDPNRLFKAIADGMTRSEYLRKNATVWLAESRVSKATASTETTTPTKSEASIPPEPSEDMTIEAQFHRFKTIAHGLKAKLHEAEESNRKKDRVIACMQRQIALLKKELDKINAAIACGKI